MTTIKQKYGFLPKSVWHLRKESDLRCFFKDNNYEVRENKRTGNGLRKIYRFSEFNPKVAERVIKYWSDKKDLVFDPFAGRATRGFIANLLDRYYIGCEISKKTYDFTIQFREELNKSQLEKSKEDNFVLLHCDGCQYHEEIEDNEVDLIFTCPPYWTLERYESCPNQLSDCKTYESFISKISESIKECSRVIKDNKFSIWVVSDFRLGKYYNFHKDIIDLHLKNNFEMWDIIINVLDSPFVALKAKQNDDNKYMAKTHEYILVFKKKPSEITQLSNESCPNGDYNRNSDN